MTFSIKSRAEEIKKLKTRRLDLLIIGGGITGAGVALQASAAGMRTALIDMQDFGAGTSSRSTRLVHGGIRYLKSFDVEVVSDTVQERAVIQHVAPHVTRPDPMLLPIYDEPGTTFSMFSVKVAMDLYDRLAGINESEHLKKYANYTLDKDQVLKLEPQLNPENLAGGGIYLDYLNNDSRLVIENIKKAHELGGLMVSRMKAVKVIHNQFGNACGVTVKDMLSGEEFDVKAKIVLNASGPWSDFVKDLDDKHDKAKTQMRPTKGVHLVVDQSKLNVPKPTYFGSGTNDGRMIFTIPRDGKTYFGTTDTDFKGDLTHPKVEQSDVDYLLKIINKKYPEAHITLDDVESSWAGVRPLVAEEPAPVDDKKEEEKPDVVSGASDSGSHKLTASQVSRGSSLKRADDGLITLAGGKLTDYRKMADGAMKMIIEIMNSQYARDYKPVDSANIKVSGGDFDSDHAEEELKKYAQEAVAAGVDPVGAEKMANIFGSNTEAVIADAKNVKAIPGLSLAETLSLHYSMENEMTLTPEDYLFRRTNNLLFNHDEIKSIKDGVISEMARYYDWSDDQIKDYTEKTNELISEAELDYLKDAKTVQA
ncbi:alpha-glycerophosphate oxidase [Companilactobacillus crustorum]|uniref:Alpha-glycerophosphate oxidase n=3 Tax=Companilactobacillus TaxID=2767879 RepID=A0A837RHZ0_9LACO|nr:FAD-dependent oxidoreductase [Companilactobacillus crustorum]APU70470.1 Alpha-glycerophosphate oxidase [Companilactobacillus crustorum]KRK42870.1 glycerol-3-phosphate dehydrogenase [Companilactobacillus crustorum JCM 15951]KRO20560.1 glycerol-3-phosphate dehydrogenase [Companilactobacillus crustorum]GEO76744.1 alpha-glycerophosphate oxidase [Companilactobacillus crustorum]